MEDLRTTIAVVMVGYVVLMVAIGALAQRRVSSVEDYVLAGRRLGFWLATPTLLATWFGAGTLLTAADEVRARGVEAATLDPIGAGLCLLIAGWLFVGPLYRMQLTTLPDFFRERFGPGAEIFAAALMVPSYFGWLAAQFIALGGMLELFFDIPLGSAMAIVAVVGTGYTLMGGMWAVTLTDAVQMALILVGLVVMVYVVGGTLGEGDFGAGLTRLATETPSERLTLVPTQDLAAFSGWLGVLCAGALGNIPSQDLMQRVFAARSETVARRACLAAGGAYLVLGTLPVGLGLAGALLAPGDEAASATLPLLAHLFLHPMTAIVFVVTLMSVILSTIDSALLAPATVLARNILERHPRLSGRPLALNRFAVVLVAALSLGVGYAGESAWGLLESSYELGMVSLLAPLALGLFTRPSRAGALASMAVGTLVWLAHLVAGAETFLGLSAEIPVGLPCLALSFAAWPLARTLAERSGTGSVPPTTRHH